MSTGSPQRKQRPGIVALLLLLACATDPAGPPESVYAQRFDDVWRTFDEIYPYFEFKEIDWVRARVEHRPAAERAATQQQLADAVVALLGSLRDIHVTIKRPDGSQISTYTPKRAANWDRAAWSAHVNRGEWHQGQTNWGWARFAEVGYIAIGQFNPAQVKIEEVDAAIEQLRPSSAMIIDVRMNGGGNSQLADQIAGRFLAASRVGGFVRYRNGPRHGDLGPFMPITVSPRGPWQYQRPVIVLAGRGSFSSTEMFVGLMREVPHVTIVGDTTGGGSGNPAFYDLGEGWEYSVSRWIHYTADRTVVEWNGIPPDVAVPAGLEDFGRGVDPVLDYALRLASTKVAGSRTKRL
jgi:C-terminal processing protease CtpA/Prc